MPFQLLPARPVGTDLPLPPDEQVDLPGYLQLHPPAALSVCWRLYPSVGGYIRPLVKLRFLRRPSLQQEQGNSLHEHPGEMVLQLYLLK